MPKTRRFHSIDLSRDSDESRLALAVFRQARQRAGPAKTGSQIGILGQGFNSSSVVKFAGVTATTNVGTGTTFILATVPAGALTGKSR